MTVQNSVKFNITKIMLEELVPHLIKVRHSNLVNEINIEKVIEKLLQDNRIPKLTACNTQQLNQQKIYFNQNHLFSVRRIINSYLDIEASRVSYRVSNSIVQISSRQRAALIKKNRPSSFRETFRKSPQRNHALAS